MTSQEYSKLLKDPLWLQKRNIIIQRDNNQCVICGSNKKLQVHHKFYREGCLPWEYENEVLVTLCQDCHYKEHAKKDFIELFNTFRELGELRDYFNIFTDIVYIEAIKCICKLFKPIKELDGITIRIHLYENWQQDKNSKKIVKAIKNRINTLFKRHEKKGYVIKEFTNTDVDNLLHYLRDKFYKIRYVDYDTKEVDLIIYPRFSWFVLNHKFKYDEQGNLKEEIYCFSKK